MWWLTSILQEEEREKDGKPDRVTELKKEYSVSYLKYPSLFSVIKCFKVEVKGAVFYSNLQMLPPVKAGFRQVRSQWCSVLCWHLEIMNKLDSSSGSKGFDSLPNLVSLTDPRSIVGWLAYCTLIAVLSHTIVIVFVLNLKRIVHFSLSLILVLNPKLVYLYHKL